MARSAGAAGCRWETVPEEEKRETAEPSLDAWRLLFRLDSGVSTENVSLDFGGCGSIYFNIRIQDLAA